MGGGDELCLKLLVEKKAGKVLFAEAGKEVVDFILSFLALPMGSVVHLLSNHAMPGSLGDLHSSVEALDVNYIDGSGKSFLLNPKSPPFPISNKFKKPSMIPELTEALSECTLNSQIYASSFCSCYAPVKGMRCLCGFSLKKTLTNICSREAEPNIESQEGGFAKEGITYMIMDNLAVLPILSAISTIDILNKYNVKNLGSLEQRVVYIGKEESKTVLSDLFFGVKGEYADCNTADYTVSIDDEFWMFLMMDKKYGKVKFAQAGLALVNFIFSSFEALLSNLVDFNPNYSSLGGCAGKFYKSVQALNISKVKNAAKHGTKPRKKLDCDAEMLEYMIMDDLEVRHMPTDHGYDKLIGSLRKRLVRITKRERMEIVRMSFTSGSVFTDLFSGQEENVVTISEYVKI